MPIKMRLLRQRHFFQLVLACGLLWLLLIIYTHTNVHLSLDTVWLSVLRHNLDKGRLQELMSEEDNTSANRTLSNPLQVLALQREGMLNFYNLPHRKAHALYTELTSANRDTSYPLAPDFTFHIEYGQSYVVLYEDFGTGCVFRIYLFPPLPHNAERLHQVSAAALRNAYVCMVVDSRTFWFSVQQLMEGREWPFITPINTRHPRPASGVGSYTPFCYQQHMKISYHHTERLPANLFEHTINCSRNDLLCSTRIYSAISRHKFAHGTKVNSFAHDGPFGHKKAVENAAYLLSKPEIYGPDNGDRCVLECAEMCVQCRINLLRTSKPGVVSAIKMRVFETATSKPLPDWNHLMLTMQFDDVYPPQVNSVPLGSLFGATASMNDFRGAAMGRRKKTCSYEDGLLDLPATSMTGYLYLPMPFWRSASIFIAGSYAVETSLLVCYKVTTVQNLYNEEENGYFNVAKSYYTDAVDGWRTMLHLDSAWGHIVGLLMEVDNLRARRKGSVSERWAPLQSDMVLFIDGARSATMLGTGLEDYFSYAHGFALAENTSYSFVGVYHSSPKRNEPLTWHCYRLHLIDPIPFQTSVSFIMEGMKPNWFQEEKPLTWGQHREHMLVQGGAAISHMVLYYAKQKAGATTTDQVHIGDRNSEKKHSFEMLNENPRDAHTFRLSKHRYLGNAMHNITYNKSGRVFEPGDEFQFTLKIFKPNRGVILRREFYSKPKKWNEQAKVWVNGVSQGTWYVPFGALSEEYSLREEDLLVRPEITQHSNEVCIKLVMESFWWDISYRVLVLH